MTKFKTLRHALMMTAATLGGTIVATVADRPAYAQEAVRTYAIPAQDLDGALRAFAMQTGRDVLYPPAIVAGKRSPGVQGSRTEGQALTALLVGTGLRFERTASGGYAVQDVRSPARTVESGEMAASELEDVVVTGTNIRGAAPIGSPLLVFTQEDFQNAGADTPQEFMATVVQNFGGAQSADRPRLPETPSDLTFGSGVDLRGLGSGTTLVLLNGRRLPLSGDAAYVDISMIPLSAVERIEILTDGASAIYGSDAIGGVINIITRANYVGGDTTVSAGVLTRGGGEEYRVAQTFGTSWGSGSAILSAEVYKLGDVNNTDIGILDGEVNEQVQLGSGQDMFSALASARQNLTDSIELVGDLTFSQRRATGGTTYEIYGYSVTYDTTNVTAAGSVGLNIDLPGDWVAAVVAAYSSAESDGVVEYHGITNRQERASTYETRGADASITGSLITLPAGAVRAAFGVGYREESYEVDSIGLGSGAPKDQFASTNAFAEFNIPLLRAPAWSASPRMQLSLAGRYDDYDHFGSSVNPRIGLEFLATPNLKLRAAYSTSYRAPTLEQTAPGETYVALYNPFIVGSIGPLVSVTGTDPDLGPETSESWSGGFVWEPESVSGLSVSLNGYYITYKDRISTPPFSSDRAMVDDPAYDGILLVRGDLPDSEFDALVQYYLSGGDAGPVIEACGPFITLGPCPSSPSAYGYISYLGVLTNLASTTESGLDLRVRQSFDSVAGGKLELGFDANYIIELSSRISPSAPSVDRLNLLFQPVDLRVRGSAVWRGDEWTIAGYVNYVAEHINNRITPNERIPAFTTFDATARWNLGRQATGALSGVQLVFSVANVFDDLPPPFADPSGIHGYDVSNGDPWGRRVSLSITKSW